jgi:hypothetical protein
MQPYERVAFDPNNKDHISHLKHLLIYKGVCPVSTPYYYHKCSTCFLRDKDCTIDSAFKEALEFGKNLINDLDFLLEL